MEGDPRLQIGKSMIIKMSSLYVDLWSQCNSIKFPDKRLRRVKTILKNKVLNSTRYQSFLQEYCHYVHAVLEQGKTDPWKWIQRQTRKTYTTVDGGKDNLFEKFYWSSQTSMWIFLGEHTLDMEVPRLRVKAEL